MSEKNFTLFELHLDGDTQFGPRSLPNLGTTGDADTEASGVGTSPMESDGEADADDGRPVLPAIIGLVVLAGLAFAVRKYRSDDGEPASIEDREVVVN